MSIADSPELASPLPESVAAEQALLGAIFVNNSVLDHVEMLVAGSDFARPVHGRIYETCQDMRRRGEEANPVTLWHVFEHDPDLEEAGGGSYLGRVACAAITVINAPNYARIVADLAKRRAVLDVESDLQREVKSLRPDQDVSGAIERARERLDQIQGGADTGDEHHYTNMSATTKAIDQIETAFQRNGALPGISTGLASVDDMLGGLQAPHLVVVAGATSMGKSALALQMARAAAGAGVTTLYMSLEMEATELATRSLSAVTGINTHALQFGRIEQPDFDAIYRAKKAQDIPLHYDDLGGQTLAHISTTARRYARQNLGLLVIDYLQFMQPPGATKNINRADEIAQMTAGLKALAKDLRIPVLLLSQVNREPGKREIKRPGLTDLRGSGSIEQDADIVCFVYRAEFYLQNMKPDPTEAADYADWQEKMDKARGKAALIVAKNRHGPTGDIELRWDALTMRFADAV